MLGGIAMLLALNAFGCWWYGKYVRRKSEMHMANGSCEATSSIMESHEPLCGALTLKVAASLGVMEGRQRAGVGTGVGGRGSGN